MKRLALLIFTISSLIGSEFDDFSQFAQFEKQDKEAFKKLESKVKRCINNWNFSCARDNLYKMKKHIVSKKDSRVIDTLWTDLYTQEREKKEYEEAQRLANSTKSIEVYRCDFYKKGLCDLKVNNAYDGVVFYKYKNGEYMLDIMNSKNAKATVGGYYPDADELYVPYCGHKYDVGGLFNALNYFANCAINSKFQ